MACLAPQQYMISLGVLGLQSFTETATSVTAQASSPSFVLKFESYCAYLLNSMRTWSSDMSTFVMTLQTLRSEHVAKRPNRHEAKQGRVLQS